MSSRPVEARRCLGRPSWLHFCRRPARSQCQRDPTDVGIL